MVQGQKKGNEKSCTGHFHEDLHSMLQWFLWLQSQWLTASHIPADTKPLHWFKAVHRTKNRELLGKPGHANKRKTRHHHPWYLSPCINLWNVLMNTLWSFTVSQIFKTYSNQQAINPQPRPSSSPRSIKHRHHRDRGRRTRTWKREEISDAIDSTFASDNLFKRPVPTHHYHMIPLL